MGVINEAKTKKRKGKFIIANINYLLDKSKSKAKAKSFMAFGTSESIAPPKI